VLSLPAQTNFESSHSPNPSPGSEESFEFVSRAEEESVESPEMMMDDEVVDLGDREVPLTETLAFQFLIRFANRVLPVEFRFERDLDQVVRLCGDGVVQCLMLNELVVPEMVDIRALNIPAGEALTFEERCENHILCLNSLMSISQHQQRKLDPEALAHGDLDVCLELLWRIVDLATVHRISVHRFPELRALQGDDEDIFRFLQLSTEELLLRWVNFTLSASDATKSVQNIGDDLSDARIFLELQSILHPELPPPATDVDERERAAIVVANCTALEMASSNSVDDLLSGDVHLNCIFLSELFFLHHGLSIPSDSSDDFETDVEEFDDEGSREERTFRMWLNSLGCKTTCSSLFSPDFRSGWMLLEVVERLQPKCINWNKANKPPFKSIVSRIKSVENCSQVVRVAKERLKLSLVGIGGDDIADGKRKPILALVWQLLRLHTLIMLNSALESSPSPRSVLPAQAQEDLKKRLNEGDILAWANNMLDISGSQRRITSFRDAELSNSLALLDLLKSIEPHAVQEKHIKPGVTVTEKELNAKYVLSVARKLGATIFIIWEDITEVKPKMLLLLIASFMLLDKRIRKMHKAATLHHRTLKETPSVS